MIDPLKIQNNYIVNLCKVTFGLTTCATFNMINVHVFKAAQARRAYFFLTGVMTIHVGGQQPGQKTAAPSNTLTTSFIITS